MAKAETSVFPATWRGRFQKTALAAAKWAGYSAAQPSITKKQSSRYNTNPNSISAQIERVQLAWNAEGEAKNNPLAIAYLAMLRRYCCPTGYTPNTGDPILNKDIKDYLDQKFQTGGINQTTFQAFSQASLVEHPIRGDSALVWVRCDDGYKQSVVCADQIGELYQFSGPARVGIDGLQYYSGMFFDSNGIRRAFRIYQRGYNQVYCNPAIYPASDVIYFNDSLMVGIRGISHFYGSIIPIAKADMLFNSGIDSAHMQSKRGIIISNESGGAYEDTYKTRATENGDIIHIEVGRDGSSTEYKFNGDSYQAFAAIAPGQELIDGVKLGYEMGAAALGVSYSFLIDPSKLTGSTARIDVSKITAEAERIQESNEVHLNKIAYVHLMDAVDRRIFPADPRILVGSYIYRNSPTADAFNDSKDNINSVRAGQWSNTRVLASQGTTPENIAEDRENEVVIAYQTLDRANKRLASAGVTERATINDIFQNSDNPQQIQPQDNQDSNKAGQFSGDKSIERIVSAMFKGFVESEHPRGQPGNSGEFGSGGRSQKRSVKASRGEMHDATKDEKTGKITLNSGDKTPDHIKDGMIAPAYRHNISLSKDPNADIWAIGHDDEGNAKPVYNPKYLAANADIKFGRVSSALNSIETIDSALAKGMIGKDTEEASVAFLMRHQATRPGSETDTKGNKSLWGESMSRDNVDISETKSGSKNVSLKFGDSKIPIRDDKAKSELISRVNSGGDLHDAGYWLKSHGATTLEGRHVVQSKDGTRLQFMGKEGVWHDHKIENPELEKMLIDRKNASGENGKIFNTNESKVAKYTKTLHDGSLSPKDFRTIRANEIAHQEVNPTDFSSEKDMRDAKMRVASKVSSVLGNRPAQALESYISPEVFNKYKLK